MRHFPLLNLIRSILEENPAARSSDNILFAEVLKSVNTSLSPNVERAVIQALYEGFGGVNFDSVRRSRQKIQQLNPDLQPPERIRARRKARQAEIETELRGYEP